MGTTRNEVLAEANKWVGTKESPANSNNVIFNTDFYGKPVSGSAYPWCVVFLWDIFRRAGASSLFYGGGKCAYSPELANYYKKQGRFYSTPKIGDIVFYQFSGSNRINHVGIVIDIPDGNTIKTIEGNTSTGNDSNGGAVEIRKRARTYVRGYGRPAYSDSGSTPTPTPTPETGYSFTKFVKELQGAIGAKVDGEPGPETLSKTPTISRTKNHKHAAVKPVQKYLNYIGYNCGTADGIIGKNTENAMKKFQSQWMKTPDGEFTAKQTSWKKILKLA